MIVHEFALDTERSNLAKITLTGSYPEQGKVMNTVSEMAVYVEDGAVVLERDGQRDRLIAGEAVLVKKGTSYSWHPETTTTLLVFSTPPWTAEQQRIFYKFAK